MAAVSPSIASASQKLTHVGESAARCRRIAYLGCMVEGDGGKQVVGDMGVGDVVEEVVQEAEGALHGGQGPPQPVPLVVGVVGQVGMGVLQQGDDYNPAGGQEVGDAVHLRAMYLLSGDSRLFVSNPVPALPISRWHCALGVIGSTQFWLCS